MARGRILVADDNPDILRLVDVNLRFEDYDTITAANGEDALALARQERPDLILLDIMLPRMDGWQVLKGLKSDPLTRTIPVILMTGMSLRSRQERELVEGVTDYLSKPFNPLRLLEIVRAQVGDARSSPVLPPEEDEEEAVGGPTRVVVVGRSEGAGFLQNLLGNPAISVLAVVGEPGLEGVELARDLNLRTFRRFEEFPSDERVDLVIDTGERPDPYTAELARHRGADVISGRALRFMNELLSERDQSHLKERDLVRELNQRVEELSILNEMSRIVSTPVRAPELYFKSLEQGLRLSDFVGGAILFYDTTEERFVTRATQGLSEGFAQKARLSLSDPVMDEVLTLRRPLAIQDVGMRFPSALIDAATREGLASLIVLPVRVKDKVVGLLVVATRTAHAFTQEEIRLLSTIAGQMAIAIENEQLSDNMRQKQAMIEQLLAKVIQAQEDERKHLAAEIHDSVAQSLAGMLTQIQICQSLMGAGAIEQVQEQLQTLRKVIADSVKEVRQIIFNLRPSSLDDLGLIPSIENYLTRFEREHHLRVQFTVGEVRRRMPTTLETTVFRIVQEALHNVRKHAQAQQVVVKLRMDNHSVALSVMDDGQGFRWKDLENKLITGEAHGLAGMRERAVLLGGSFKVSTQEGRGTMLQVEIPIPKEPRTAPDTLSGSVEGAGVRVERTGIPQQLAAVGGALEWLGEQAALPEALQVRPQAPPPEAPTARSANAQARRTKTREQGTGQGQDPGGRRSHAGARGHRKDAGPDAGVRGRRPGQLGQGRPGADPPGQS